jgi:hypothetical protein
VIAESVARDIFDHLDHHRNQAGHANLQVSLTNEETGKISVSCRACSRKIWETPEPIEHEVRDMVHDAFLEMVEEKNRELVAER